MDNLLSSDLMSSFGTVHDIKGSRSLRARAFGFMMNTRSDVDDSFFWDNMESIFKEMNWDYICKSDDIGLKYLLLVVDVDSTKDEVKGFLEGKSRTVPGLNYGIISWSTLNEGQSHRDFIRTYEQFMKNVDKY